MKKRVLLLLAAALLFSLAACGGKTAQSAAPSGGASAAGKTVTKPYLHFLVPDGWTEVDFDDSKAVQLIKDRADGTFISLKLLNEGVTADENAEYFKSQMDGYGAAYGENVTLAGCDCLCASYESDGRKIVQYQGVDASGRQLSVQLYDLTADDPTVKAVLESLKF